MATWNLGVSHIENLPPRAGGVYHEDEVLGWETGALGTDLASDFGQGLPV